MYYVCKRTEWSREAVRANSAYIIEEALAGLQGEWVTEDQIRFALDVYAQELEGNSWKAFEDVRPDMINGKRIKMDQREIEIMQDEVIGRIKDLMQPITETVQADAMQTLEEFERKWGIQGLSYGVSEIAKKRVVASMFKLAKDDKTCGCGHHERAHRAESGGDPTERRCQLCSGGRNSRGGGYCNKFTPAGRSRF